MKQLAAALGLLAMKPRSPAEFAACLAWSVVATYAFANLDALLAAIVSIAAGVVLWLECRDLRP